MTSKRMAIAAVIALALKGALRPAVAASVDPPKKTGAKTSSPKARKGGGRKRPTVDAGVKVFAIKSEAPVKGGSPDAAPRLNVRLIWGATSEAAAQTRFQTLEPELTEKLEKAFPWKSYFKILDKDLDTPLGMNVTTTLSPKAKLRVRAQKDSSFRIRLFGEGNRVINRIVTIGEDDIIALAGYDEHKLGWFIVLKRARAAAPDAP